MDGRSKLQVRAGHRMLTDLNRSFTGFQPSGLLDSNSRAIKEESSNRGGSGDADAG